jgi:hypothetical protein
VQEYGVCEEAILSELPNAQANQGLPPTGLTMLEKGHEVYVLTKHKVTGRYIVGRKRMLINAQLAVKGQYEILAEHHDREVLEKLKQLATEGDNERLIWDIRQ